MKAPTNVYGPDGTLCKQGEEIPAAWHKEMPDLKAHLARIGAFDPSSSDADPEPPTTTVALTGTTDRARTGESA